MDTGLVDERLGRMTRVPVTTIDSPSVRLSSMTTIRGSRPPGGLRLYS